MRELWVVEVRYVDGWDVDNVEYSQLEATKAMNRRANMAGRKDNVRLVRYTPEVTDEGRRER